jgi:hypothetical protein
LGCPNKFCPNFAQGQSGSERIWTPLIPRSVGCPNVFGPRGQKKIQALVPLVVRNWDTKTEFLPPTTCPNVVRNWDTKTELLPWNFLKILAPVRTNFEHPVRGRCQSELFDRPPEFCVRTFPKPVQPTSSPIFRGWLLRFFWPHPCLPVPCWACDVTRGDQRYYVVCSRRPGRCRVKVNWISFVE